MSDEVRANRSWRQGVVGDCVAELSSGTSVNGEDKPADLGEIGVLKVSCVAAGAFRPEQNKRVTESDLVRATCPVEAGRIIVSRANTADLVGSSALIDRDMPDLYLSDKLWKIRAQDGCDPAWLHSTLASPAVRKRLSSGATGSSGSMKNISKNFFLSSPIEIPPLAEQQKIARILNSWRHALDKLAALRAAKKQRLNGLRAALLFGNLRLKGQQHRWRSTRFASVTHELTERNGAKGLGRQYVMGVTKAKGVVPMREQTIAADISRYKRLPPRAFAYNPMRINVGSIAMNEREEEVLVSPDYVVFACNAVDLAPDYLDHLRKTPWWAHYINSGGSGSVRQRTYYDDLAALKPSLPELDEQKAIVTVLNTARDDLAATEREIEALARQKRGLMQKLLTGEWRVQVEAR